MLKKDKPTPLEFITAYKWLFWLIGAVIGLGLLAFLPLNQPSLTLSLSPDQLAIRNGEIVTDGFFGAEQDTAGNKYIWTNGNPSIRLDTQTHKPIQVTLELRSAAVAGGKNAHIQVLFDGTEVTQVTLDPSNFEFQSISFKIPDHQTKVFKLEFQTETFVPPGDPRHLGFMVKSISIDRSEAWSPISSRVWLYWVVGVLLLLLLPVVWLSRRLTYLWLKIFAIAIILSGIGAIVLALYLWLKYGPIDSTVYFYWIITTCYIGFYFVLMLVFIQIGKTNLMHRLVVWLKPIVGWFYRFTEQKSSAQESLIEYYRFRPVILTILAIAFVVNISWGLTIMPAGIWLTVWIPVLVVIFGIILIPTLQQLKQGKIASKQTTQVTNNKSEKKPIPLWIALTIIFVTAFIFTTILNSFNVQWPIWDASSYDKITRNIVTNGFVPDALRPPGYVFLVSQFNRWFGEDFYQPFYLFQYTLNSFTAVLVFSMALLVTGKRSIAWWGGLATALCPFTAGYAGALLTETTAIFLYTATIFLTIIIIKRPQVIIYYALLGLTVIFLLEVRYNFQLFLLVPIGLILIFRRINFKAKLLNLAVLGIMGLTILTPPIVANYKAYDRFIISTPADNFSASILLATQFNHGHWFRELVDVEKVSQLLKKYNGATDYAGCQINNCPQLEIYRKQLSGFFKEYFELYGWNYAERVVTHLWDYWNQNYIFPYSFPLPDYYTYSIFTNNLNRLYLIFMMTGLWFLWGYRLVALPIYGAIFYLLIIQSIFWVEPRYMLPIYPTILFVAALGLVTFSGKFRQWRTSATGVRTGKAWWVIPLLATMLIAVLTPLVKSDTTQETYNMQIQATEEVFKYANTPYYSSKIVQLQQSLEKMTEMPEYSIAENQEKVETYLARVLLRQNNNNGAIEHANKAIAVNKNSFEAYHWRSIAYQNLGQNEAAAQDKAIFEKLLPESMDYLRKLKN